MSDRNLALLPPTLAVVAVLGMGLLGCADIHPAPDEQEEGMLESPTDEADQFRRAEENAQEDHEGEEHRQ